MQTVKIKCKNCAACFEFEIKNQLLTEEILFSIEEVAAQNIIGAKYACGLLKDSPHSKTDICTVKSAHTEKSQDYHGRVIEKWVTVEMDESKRTPGITPNNPAKPLN